MKKADYVPVGRILRSQGERGEVKLRLFAEASPAVPLKKIYVQNREGFQAYDVESFRVDRHSHLMKLAGVDSLSRAEELRGAVVFVPEEDFPPLADGYFYEFQLVGSVVRTASGKPIGQIKGVQMVRGNSLLIVAGEKDEILVPFTASICISVNASRKEIVIDPPDGLLELNEI